MSMNRQQRRQAAKEFQAQLRDPALAGAVDLANRPPKAITFGYPTTGTVATGFHKSVLAAGSHGPNLGFAFRLRDCEHDGNLAKAKNLLLKDFLQGTDEYLLLADTNIAFAPQDVAMLIATDAAIAGALYFTAATGSESWPVAWVEGEDGAYAPLTLPTPPEDFDESNQEQLEAWMAELSLPIKVAAVGTGLALIKREAALAVADRWPYPFEVEHDQDEDLTFGIRAADEGFDSVVMPAARVGHYRLGMV